MHATPPILSLRHITGKVWGQLSDDYHFYTDHFRWLYTTGIQLNLTLLDILLLDL